MIHVKITPQIRNAARKDATVMGHISGSIYGSLDYVAAFIGEIIVADYLGATRCNTAHYDMLGPNGEKIDVKTKMCNSAPMPHYECSIISHNAKQQCEEYVFVRMNRDLNEAWIVGRIPKSEYFDKAVFLKKGQRNGDNGYIVRSDCYNLSIQELYEICHVNETSELTS